MIAPQASGGRQYGWQRIGGATGGAGSRYFRQNRSTLFTVVLAAQEALKGPRAVNTIASGFEYIVRSLVRLAAAPAAGAGGGGGDLGPTLNQLEKRQYRRLNRPRWLRPIREGDN